MPRLTRTATAAPGTKAPTKLNAALSRFLRPTKENPKHPTFAGAVALVSVGGKVKSRAVVGDALRYGAGPVELPPAKRVADARPTRSSTWPR